MVECTLCFLADNNRSRVCLGYKKRGFGEGLWNGAGGKIDAGETPDQAMMRELSEEFGVVVDPSDLNNHGIIEFYFDTENIKDIRGHIYVVESWFGDPSESEEMIPHWFHVDDIPYKNMWADDPHWLPHVLAGKKIKEAKFHFDKDGQFERVGKLEFH